MPGDVTQFSVVLKHLRRHRPDWQITVVVGRGKEGALRGLCHKVLCDQDPEPAGPFDTELTLGWYENYLRFGDRPNSKVTNCLMEVFGLGYDADLGRYHVSTSRQAMHTAAQYLTSVGCTPNDQGKFNAVILHYEGNTSPSKKNLAHWQAQEVCKIALRAGRVPVILDWDARSPLPDGKAVFTPGCGQGDIWGGFGSGDAEVIAALIRQSEAFVGIDSGPGKVASSTDTPSLIYWKGHHPIQFHDPAENTLHLVPSPHRALTPASENDATARYFEEHYRYLEYQGDHGLVACACRWLAEALGAGNMADDITGVKFVLPGGIGDTVWALTKIRHVASGRPVDLVVSGDPKREVDKRALPFLRRFSFVRSCEVSDVPVLADRESPTDGRGRYRYVPDGARGQHHFLVPNRTLEAGRRLEEWLPELPCDWDVMDRFSWEGTERGDELGKVLEPFVAFYLGPEVGNTSEGHNRGWLWEPKDWVALGKAMKERGLSVAVVGAEYDRSFWERYVREGVAQAGLAWYDLIGKLEIGETFACLKHAKCLISYQCGLGIVGHYLRVRVAMWWRPEGDSCHESRLVSFSEAMKDGWTRPGAEDTYMGLVYTRCSPEGIVAEADKRGWLQC